MSTHNRLTHWQKTQIREAYRAGHTIQFFVSPECDALVMHSTYKHPSGVATSTAVSILSHSQIRDRLKLYTLLNAARDFLAELEYTKDVRYTGDLGRRELK